MVIWLPLHQSRGLRCLHWLQCIFAALALWHANWPAEAQIVLLLLIALFARHQSALPQALYFDSEGLQLVYPESRRPAKLGAQCYCTEYWILLEIVEQEPMGLSRRSRSKRLLLLPDSSSPNALRRLRIYLRWRAQAIEHSAG